MADNVQIIPSTGELIFSKNGVGYNWELVYGNSLLTWSEM